MVGCGNFVQAKQLAAQKNIDLDALLYPVSTTAAAAAMEEGKEKSQAPPPLLLSSAAAAAAAVPRSSSAMVASEDDDVEMLLSFSRSPPLPPQAAASRQEDSVTPPKREWVPSMYPVCPEWCSGDKAFAEDREARVSAGGSRRGGQAHHKQGCPKGVALSQAREENRQAKKQKSAS